MESKITFIIPCRNNLKYLQQVLNSIETHYKDFHNIVILDDASTDGSWDWITQYSVERNNIIIYKNEGSYRIGHTVLYDKGIELAKTDIVSILHSDMVVTPNYVQNMLKHLKEKTVVSATRIEPPLHPPGPEKLVMNFGFDTEEFNEDEFLKFAEEHERESRDAVTSGIFAPWMIYKKDFIEIGGHDFLFAPMELEDSDIFNRMLLAGYNLIQSRDALVYHMTCRGSRFKDGIEIEREIPLSDGTIWYKPKDSEEYIKLRQNKFREWWRKWHTDVLHDELMMPKVGKRYDTAFVVKNCTPQLLQILEPWCDSIYVDCEIASYIESENKESEYDISKRVHLIENEYNNDIVIKFDAQKLTQQLFLNFIKNLPFIIEQTNQVGSFNYEIFTIEIKKLKEIEMIKPHFKNVF